MNGDFLRRVAGTQFFTSDEGCARWDEKFMRKESSYLSVFRKTYNQFVASLSIAIAQNGDSTNVRFSKDILRQQSKKLILMSGLSQQLTANQIQSLDTNFEESELDYSTNSVILTHGSAIEENLSGTPLVDRIIGSTGNDSINGEGGSDLLVGDNLPNKEDYDENGYIRLEEQKSFNDVLRGHDEGDLLVDQFGSDHFNGGDGDDHLISLSDSGSPAENTTIPAGVNDGDDISKQVYADRHINPENHPSNDRLNGGSGADTFEWRLAINARKEIVEKHTDANGDINWGMNGVAGENNNYHDHWVDGIGKDKIVDFSGMGGEGDHIIIDGHTVKAKVIKEVGNTTTIGLYSDQGNNGERGNGAHDLDVLGIIKVNHDGNFDFENDVTVKANDYGAYGNDSGISDFVDNAERLYALGESLAGVIPAGIFKRGSTSNERLVGGKQKDIVLGNQGDDRIVGRNGDDILVGDTTPNQHDYDGDGLIAIDTQAGYNDMLKGGFGEDTLLDQFGSDRFVGGEDSDHLISLSDSGISAENKDIPAGIADGNDLSKLEFSARYINPYNHSSNDMLIGGAGADKFEWRLAINANREIVDKHTNRDGIINWGMNGVAGENDNYHDHWVDAIGEDTIKDFSGTGGEGDRIVIDGHTVDAMLIHTGVKIAIIGVYSDQGNDGERGNGAHDFDVLGTIKVRHDGHFSFDTDVSVLNNDYGAYDNDTGAVV